MRKYEREQFKFSIKINMFELQISQTIVVIQSLAVQSSATRVLIGDYLWPMLSWQCQKPVPGV